ncbi:BQ5605_C005g03556 [Microbotryum silenes-dioicae]|uniref:BQ5605_C005g03556 protein n=1 Tax=Microbotryum silenes-dioicae TaxID=796604 RepID=A0A2X0N503_9BASI|nr:BQ5605_C005g03556 [Microbotryum silenes-dioicae]
MRHIATSSPVRMRSLVTTSAATLIANAYVCRKEVLTARVHDQIRCKHL